MSDNPYLSQSRLACKTRGPFRGVVGSSLKVLFVLRKQDRAILSSSFVRSRLIVPLFQPLEDLMGDPLICLPSFKVKLSQDLR